MALTYEEYTRRMREVTAAWSKRYADRIPNHYPVGSDPHPGVPPAESDYGQFHAQYGAPPEYMDLLEEKLAELDALWQAPDNVENRRRGPHGRA